MSKIEFIVREFLTWQSVLDIALIATGLFVLYRTLVRLGTWKILAGIVVAFLVYIVANILNLEGIEWIFQNLSHVTVIALIVIFQPELRKLLEKVVSVQKKNPLMSSDSLGHIVADSLWKLAKQKNGALVVFPGSEPIQEKLSGGHKLAAEPSMPLIMSIFDPNSPGHDGAMIIADNKLDLFGVRLPMSQTARLPEEFGTRHHAAMGLAEHTDALVLVVSEERGIVSSFKNGAMKIMDTPEKIVATIKNHCSHADIFNPLKFGIIDRRTLLPAALCLIVATIFWSGLITMNRQVITRVLTLPLEYGNPVEGLQLVGDKIEEVRVQLNGPKSEIDNYLMSQPTVKVDLSSMVEGKQTILLSGDNLQLPANLSFLGSKPAQIAVNLAAMTKRTVPIVPQLLGSLPNNLKIKQVRVIPNELQVMVPSQKKGDKPFTVSTTPIYLNSVEGESRILAKIIATPPIQPVIRPWPDVEVIIDTIESGK